MIINTLNRILQQHDPDTRQVTSSGRGPIGVQVSKSGHLLIIRPRVNLPNSVKPSLGDRGEIDSFSPSSACRMRRYLRECLPDYRVLITLTYPFGFGFNGRQSKRHLKMFLQRLKRRADSLDGNSNTYGSFWFAEFQQRGSLHYHIFTTHRFPKEWVSKAWYETVGSEDERHLLAGTRIESIKSGRKGICAYASKYAAKQQQKVVPKDFGWVGRFWGVSGWRGSMSADTWLEPEDTGTKAVMRWVNKLESTIKSYKCNGKCRIDHHDGGTFVVYMASMMMEVEVANILSHMNSAIDLYRPSMVADMFGDYLDCRGQIEDEECL